MSFVLITDSSADLEPELMHEKNIESVPFYVAFREELAAMLQGFSHVTGEDIPIRQLGAAIGVHTGPYPLGIAFLRKYDRQIQTNGGFV